MMDFVHFCPCYGQYTFPEEDSYEIFPVCNWEDEPVQAEAPDYRGGANIMSLNEAREAFRQSKIVS